MTSVYQDWADAVDDFTLGAINFGIEASKADPHPPNQGEFIAHCKRYNPNASVLRLDSKLSQEQIEKNRARIAEIARSLAKGKTV